MEIDRLDATFRPFYQYQAFFVQPLPETMTSPSVKTPAFFLLFIFCMFAAAKIDVNPNITSFVTNNHTVLWLVALCLISLILLQLAVRMAFRSKDVVYRAFKSKEIERRLKKLSPMEKYVLSTFITEKKAEWAFDPSSAAVAWLESTKIHFYELSSKRKLKSRFQDIALCNEDFG